MRKSAFITVSILLLLFVAFLLLIYNARPGHYIWGTRYIDAPHPFNDPAYPVVCLGIYGGDREDIALSVQQGQTTLVIPRDAVHDAFRRSDAPDCIPERVELVYVWFKDKLLRQARDNSEARDWGYSGVRTDSIKVYVKLKNLMDSPEEMLAGFKEPSAYRDPKRYDPQYHMAHYPLYLYPNMAYDSDNSWWGGRWGVIGTINPRTGYPYTVFCNMEVPHGDLNRERKMLSPVLLRQVINARMTPTREYGESLCRGHIWIVKNYTVLQAEIKVQPDVVPYIDRIYPALEKILTGYIHATQPDN